MLLSQHLLKSEVMLNEHSELTGFKSLVHFNQTTEHGSVGSREAVVQWFALSTDGVLKRNQSVTLLIFG